MHPRVQRALRQTRRPYAMGGPAEDPHARIAQILQPVQGGPARSGYRAAPSQPMPQPGAPPTMQTFGMQPWVSTRERLRQQQAAAPQPAPQQQQQQPGQYDDLASLLRARLPNQPWAQNVAGNPNYAIANGVYRTFRPMLEGLGMGRFLDSLGRS